MTSHPDRRRPVTRSLPFLAGIALFAALEAGPAAAADAARGRALYESRCDGCHSTGVHERASRKATAFEGIRVQVERWNAQLGGAWRRAEIDDVAVYLNDRFYRYPCPDALCGAGAARAAAPGWVAERTTTHSRGRAAE
jgi:hypothetical protein